MSLTIPVVRKAGLGLALAFAMTPAVSAEEQPAGRRDDGPDRDLLLEGGRTADLLQNGTRVAGEVKSMSNARLELATDDMGQQPDAQGTRRSSLLLGYNRLFSNRQRTFTQATLEQNRELGFELRASLVAGWPTSSTSLVGVTAEDALKTPKESLAARLVREKVGNQEEKR